MRSCMASLLLLLRFGEFGFVFGLGGFHLRRRLFDRLLPLLLDFSLAQRHFGRALFGRQLRRLVGFGLALFVGRLALGFLFRLAPIELCLLGGLIALLFFLLPDAIERCLLLLRE